MLEKTDYETVSYEALIKQEDYRQSNNIELIASENFPSRRVLDAAGSILTNKYAEGYPGKRYYGGCQFIDMIEQKAIDDACKLFNCKFANVQPHCGSSANQAVYRALLEKGDTVLGMDLGAGGHLTHGHKMSFSGQDYNIISYGLDDNGIIDYEDIENKLYKYNPKMILVGASSYSRIIDYERVARIIEDYYNKTGSKPYYMVDMAHVAGLVAAGVHPSPLGWADVVTSTTHKTLRGPRGGLILWNNEDLTKKINSAVFPGIQGGPLEHIIAAKGICFEEASTALFKIYAQNVVDNSKAFAQKFIDNNWKVISNGTDNHMFVLDVYHSIGLTGKEVETELDKINITLNKNQIPNDELPPLKSSGVRIGTAAMTTKGFNKKDFEDLADLMILFLNEVKSGKTIDYDKYKTIIYNRFIRKDFKED
ncbi:MAG: serine hydroxymethyltransferase [Bacilli bacterium]|nr:serine hydroxymethyltransferase [Bacilli bacterium]MBQ3307550.1 serine hydroxymethyltransferase [Bacilli bacterium]